VGTADELPIAELAQRVIEATGSDSGIARIPYAEVYGQGFEEPVRGRPDTTALRELTGWKPARDVGQAIDEVSAEARQGRPGAAAYVAH